jgi:hypothetical protein
MKKTLFILIIAINTSCMKDTIIVNPDSIKIAKETGAFIKEFECDTSVIVFNNNKYEIEEVYITYLIDSKKVYKHTTNLLIKTYDIKNKKYDFPDTTFFEIMIDSVNYNVGWRSRKLESEIPLNSNHFTLIYYDKDIKRVINFKEKLEK